MARRNRFSKPAIVVLSAAVVVALGVGVYKLLGSGGSSPVEYVSNPATTQPKSSETSSASGSSNPSSDPSETMLASVKVDSSAGSSGNLQQTAPSTQPVRIQVPTPTRENTPAPANTPSTPSIPGSAKTPSASGVSAKTLVEQADAKRKSEDLIEARKLLVEALDTQTLSPAEKDDVLRRLSEINDIVVFSPRRFVSDPYQEQYKVQPGDLMQKIAAKYDITWKFLGRLNGIEDPKRLQVGKTLKVVRGPFHALVDKSEFTLDIYMGKPGTPGAIFLKRFRVGLGEFDSTPTGEWLVDTKLENPRYYNPRNEGPRVIEPDDPKNPLGERWIALKGLSGQALGKNSYGIHGTIEPDSIGQKKSMGCIRMLNEDVELVYDMLISGKSTVTVIE